MATHDQWQGEAYWVLGEGGRSVEPDLGMTSPDGLNSKATSEWPHDSSEASNPGSGHDSREEGGAEASI